jgi:hypothetical protein
MGVPIYDRRREGDQPGCRPRRSPARPATATTPAARSRTAPARLLGRHRDPADADKPIRYHDEQIARAVLAHFLNLGTQTGSWALGSTFADFFTLSLQTVAEDSATPPRARRRGPGRHELRSEEPAPQLHFDEIGKSQVEQALGEMYGTGQDNKDQQQLGAAQRAQERAQYLRKNGAQDA